MTTEEKIKEAITEMLREIDRRPGDSIQDIANESFRSWQTGLRVTKDFCVDRDPECNPAPS